MWWCSAWVRLTQVLGIVVATSAVAVGVLAEAVYIAGDSSECSPGHLPKPPAGHHHARSGALYLPSPLPTIGLLGQPITGAMSRLEVPTSPSPCGHVKQPDRMLRAAGIAYTEVVVAYSTAPKAARNCSGSPCYSAWSYPSRCWCSASHR